jgi:GT2 family glycosyltransferase
VTSLPAGGAAISVLIASADQAAGLGATLESLCRQSLPAERFEVVVVDDGSTDGTDGVLRAFAGRLPLRHSYQRRAGLASALNHAIYLATGRLVLLLSDEVEVGPGLLQQHLEAHRRHPLPGVAVAGAVVLARGLQADPLASLVWGEAERCWPLGKRSGWRLGPGALGVAWLGRTSFKRDFLVERGVFNPAFGAALADVELGVRLGHHGFAPVFEPLAPTIVVRGPEFEGWCRRCQAEGEASREVARIHPSDAVRAWAGVDRADSLWAEVAPRYDAILRSGRELDRMARQRRAAGLQPGPEERQWLLDGYRAAFRASRLKGLAAQIHRV